MLRKYCEVLWKEKEKHDKSNPRSISLACGGPIASNNGVFRRVLVHWSSYLRTTNKPIFFLQVVGPITSNNGVFRRVLVHWSYLRTTNKPIFFLQVVGGAAFCNNWEIVLALIIEKYKETRLN